MNADKKKKHFPPFRGVKPIPRDSEKYLYASVGAAKYAFFYGINIATWIISFSAFFLLYDHNYFYVLFFGGIIGFIGLCGLLSAIIGSQHTRFDIARHKRIVEKFWKNKRKLPSIDIFLPISGEHPEVLRNTWEGVQEVIDSYPGEITAYVLNDDKEHSHESVGREFGFRYLDRLNKGHMKKAGNLLHGFHSSHGEHIVILDADFRPHRDFLRELLPYMQDEKIGIVQSVQYFGADEEVYKHSKLQYGAGDIQEYFYKIVQASRNKFGASICVGTNAIYRRKALESIGGTHQIEQSEDVWTGYRIISEGWKLHYLPIILAKGTCPDDIENFYKQQSRWCNGSMSLAASKTFWSAKIPFWRKLPFINGFMWYISNLLLLLLPIQSFMILLDTHISDNNMRTVLFSTALLAFLLSFSLQIYRRLTIGTILAGQLAKWSYAVALVRGLLGKKESWVATGSTMHNSYGFGVFRRIAIFYNLVVIFGFIAIASLGRIRVEWPYILPVTWIAFNIFLQSIMVYHLIVYSKEKQ
jgi:cellulose synthase (UDP-forming)